MAAGCALAAIASGGRPELAALLGLALACSLPRLLGQPLAGAVLAWEGGRWTIEQGSTVQSVVLERGPRVTPWVVFIAWRGAGAAGRSWIFADALDADSWRRLRVRLRLQG